MNKQIELNREYWGRVIDMCQGTALEGREWQCVKHMGDTWFKDHPSFDSGVLYELAVAVVEGKPVFKDSKLYNIDTGAPLNWSLGANWGTAGWKYFTWQKPVSRRTFLLNGVELPYYSESGNVHVYVCGTRYSFSTIEEASKFSQKLNKVLSKKLMFNCTIAN